MTSKIDAVKEMFDARERHRDEEQLNKIESKLDKMDDKLNVIDVMVARQQVILEEHVKRTNMLEDVVKTVNEQYAFMKVLLKVIAACAAAGAGGLGIKEVLSLFGV